MDSAATADYFIGVAQQSLWVLALASAPILLPALVAGLILDVIAVLVIVSVVTLTGFGR